MWTTHLFLSVPTMCKTLARIQPSFAGLNATGRPSTSGSCAMRRSRLLRAEGLRVSGGVLVGEGVDTVVAAETAGPVESDSRWRFLDEAGC